MGMKTIRDMVIDMAETKENKDTELKTDIRGKEIIGEETDPNQEKTGVDAGQHREITGVEGGE